MAYVRMWSECHVICRRSINQRPVDSIILLPEQRLFITFKGKSLSNYYCNGYIAAMTYGYLLSKS